MLLEEDMVGIVGTISKSEFNYWAAIFVVDYGYYCSIAYYFLICVAVWAYPSAGARLVGVVFLFKYLKLLLLLLCYVAETNEDLVDLLRPN